MAEMRSAAAAAAAQAGAKVEALQKQLRERSEEARVRAEAAADAAEQAQQLQSKVDIAFALHRQMQAEQDQMRAEKEQMRRALRAPLDRECRITFDRSRCVLETSYQNKSGESLV